MKPFKSGPALVAVEGRVPVVPLRVHVHRLGSPRLFTFLRRSDVEIRFGTPMTFSPGTDHMEATHAIEEAVRSL
jgi:1-acyl-sn-glycerol-3-phosphate acyltransferase